MVNFKISTTKNTNPVVSKTFLNAHLFLDELLNCNSRNRNKGKTISQESKANNDQKK